MNTKSANPVSRDRLERPTLDWKELEHGMRKARVLRAEAFTRAVRAPGNWLLKRIEQARAPIDFEPIGT